MHELKYKDIAEKIIGASFEVHKFLGNGFQEIFYKEFAGPIGTRRADFVVENKVLVELKAIIELEEFHVAQVLLPQGISVLD
jgi:PD-(D/E)XK nuclease superfamily protein